MKDLKNNKHLEFPLLLKAWYSGNKRYLPWKKNVDPYSIWLSEVILQQTRVEQGMPYFQRFIHEFPCITDLANASEDQVMKLWQGLGYYSRARNLHITAKYIANELSGVFPTKYEDIRALKGVGDYTAAAIASFAFKLPYAVVDGNVYRVLSRYFGIETPIDTSKGKKEFASLAQELLDKNAPDKHNQAIMDFGATHCTPKLPKCDKCPMQEKCHAHLHNRISLLPIKSKKIKRSTRRFLYFVANFSHHTYIGRREGKDIWKHLYEFPMVELEKDAVVDEKLVREEWAKLFPDSVQMEMQISRAYKQNLTHQTIIANFVEFQLYTEIAHEAGNLVPVEHKKLKNFAFPKIITCFLNDKTLYLRLN